MKIVFLGSGAFGIPSLLALHALGASHQIAHIISQPDRPAGRGGKLTPTPVSAWAADRAIPLTRTADANAAETLSLLRALAPACLVIIAFGQKLSDDLLSIAPQGGINLHSSLLPKYRGAAPINWAVINNDPVAGVSVIEVTNVMDGGAILATAQTPIGETETAGELHDRLAALGAPLLPSVLDQLAAGTIARMPQDPAQKSKAPKLSREMAWVDWGQPAAICSARIRGLTPWPGVAVELTDAAGKVRTQATIQRCRAVPGGPHPSDQLGLVLADRTIACAQGSLEILSIQPAGKKPMDLASFANGYGYDAGARLRSVVHKF